MTKIGLRDWILIICLVPVGLVSIALGGYFGYARFHDLSHYLAEQAGNIAEPLAIAAEHPLLENNKAQLQRLLNVSHRKNSPMVRTIAIFNNRNQLVVTSNQHRDFAQLIQAAALSVPRQTEQLSTEQGLLIRVPIESDLTPEQLASAQSDPADVPHDGHLGYLVVQLQEDSTLLAQQSSMLASVLIIFASLTLALALAIRLLRRIYLPLQRLMNHAERLSEQRYKLLDDDNYLYEFDVLRLGMNRLCTDLQHYKEEMHSIIEQSTSDLQQSMEQLEMQNVTLDMSRRKAVEENKLKSEFLAKMSHELRTPLNGVLGFTRQLLKTQLTPHQQDYLATIQKSANSLLSLVNDVLDYSKLEEGRMSINPEPFSLRELVYDAVELLAVNAFEKQLELALKIDASVPDNLYGDPLRINQVLLNIAGNALKFTEHGSIYIRVSAHTIDERLQLRVEVQDTGIGIHKDQQDQLFTGFTQGDGSIGRRYGGTGLGLFISQRLVQAMGGDIGFVSKPKEGTTFWFTVNVEANAPQVTDALPIAVLQEKRLLLIEPQQYSREAALTLLNSWGIHVSACATPAQLQQALDGNQYDMALICRPVSVDQLNPLLEMIRQLNQQCQHVYLLVNTLSPNLREALLQSGAQACLSKPAHYRKLAATLARPYLHHEHVVAPPSLPKAPIRVLTVDDNEANLKLINSLLSDLVETIDSAPNGAEAWQLASLNHYDIIFMDINMPLMDGVTACQRIQHASINEQTPIIAVTAHAIEGERERLLSLGFHEFLSKPLDEHMLVLTLKECCPAFTQLVAATEATSTPLPAELPQSRHLDWELAMQRSANKLDLAKDMLQILLSSIPETLQQLNSAMTANQRDTVLQVVHKLHGACCYTGVPGIRNLTETIETALKSGATLQQVEPELFELDDQLSSLFDESQQWDLS